MPYFYMEHETLKRGKTGRHRQEWERATTCKRQQHLTGDNGTEGVEMVGTNRDRKKYTPCKHYRQRTDKDR